MRYDTRSNDVRPSRRSARALGDSQSDSWVQRCPGGGLACCPVRRCGSAGLAALVARRRRVRAAVRPGVERPGLLRKAGDRAALAGGGVPGRAGGGGGPGRIVLPAGGCHQRPGSGAGGGGTPPGPAGRGRGRLVVGQQCRLRCGAVAARMEDAPVRPGCRPAGDPGGALQHDAAGIGHGSSPLGRVWGGGRRRGCGPLVPERGRPAAGDGLGVALARWRACRRPAACPHRAPARGTSRPGLGAPAGAPRPARASGR